MFSNPLLRNLLLVFGAYTLMTMLKRYDPLHIIVTAAAVAMAVIIWMLRYHRDEAYRLYQHAAMRSVIDLVCSIAGEQPPVDAVPAHAVALSALPAQSPAVVAASTSAPRKRPVVSARDFGHSSAAAPASAGTRASDHAASRILLRSPGDARLAAHAIKQRLFGMDPAIDDVLEQLVRNVRVRERSLATVSLPPLGLFLFTGGPGLGKRTLAIEVGTRLFADGVVSVLDLAEGAQTLEPVLAAVKANPHQAFVLEHIDRAPRRVQDDLLAIVSGQPLADTQSGARVTFRHCAFFLLVHAEAPSDAQSSMSGSRASFTMAVERTADATTLDALLAQSLHGLVAFRLCDRVHQARALARMMDEECQRHQLALRSISAGLLAREVQEVSAAGSFRAAPGRIGRVVGRAIHEAIATSATFVDIA